VSLQDSKRYQTIGKPIPMLGARDKLTGTARFTDDIRLSRPLFVKILRSPYPSAHLKSIDISKAKKSKGVKAVITGKDIPNSFGVLPISKDECAMATGKVRYVGEPIAAVAAESLRDAVAALRLIKVKYEVLKPVLNIAQGLKKTKNPIHPELKREDNIHKSAHQSFGDPDKGFDGAKVVIERDFSFLSLSHGFTEPHSVQVEIKDDDELTVYSATQVPHYVHLALSEVLEIPLHKIRVIKPYLGGGFGGKSDPFPHEMIAARLALMTRRNIRLTLEREEVFFTHHGRHETQVKMKLGLDPGKGITALDGKMLIDGGAYGSFGIVTSYYNGVLLQGPYKIANFRFDCDRIYTNKPVCGAMRGHGGVNPRFASESLLDMACHELKIDPCEFRLEHFLEKNSLTANQFRITSVSIKKGLEKAMTKSGWKKKHRQLPYGKGIGVACGFFISGSALPIHWNKIPQSTARLTLDESGLAVIYSGASDIGQGSDTVLAQMVAEVLGLPMGMIKVVSADTALCPTDMGSYSSRVTFMAGNAARNASIQMRRTLVKAACQLLKIDEPPYPDPGKPMSFFRQGQRKPDFKKGFLGANPDYEDGFSFSEKKIISPANEELDYLEVVKKAMEENGTLQAKGCYLSPKMGGTHKGAGAGLSPSYSFTAFITEVDVNPLTGKVKVEKVTCAHDCGVPLNPLAVEGQLEGSIHMGLGQVLMEGLRYEHGVQQNASFLEYKIPSPFEQPEIEIILPDSDEQEGPFGAKEVGEGALAPFNPSVANAIFDAVAVRLFDLPITPDKVLDAIHKNNQKKD